MNLNFDTPFYSRGLEGTRGSPWMSTSIFTGSKYFENNSFTKWFGDNKKQLFRTSDACSLTPWRSCWKWFQGYLKSYQYTVISVSIISQKFVPNKYLVILLTFIAAFTSKFLQKKQLPNYFMILVRSVVFSEPQSVHT